MTGPIATTNLHSIFLTRGNTDAAIIPSEISGNIARFQAKYPDWTHKLFRNEEGLEFIEKYFDRETVDSFNTLVPLAYKADLLRYCLIYHFGGMYSDLSLMHLEPLISPNDACKCFVFRDAPPNGPSIISNSLIYSQPHSIIFEEAIKKINENVKNRDYGSNDLCPTGPVMLGKLVASHFKPNIMRCGHVQSAHNAAGNTHLYFDDTGRLIAVKHKMAQGLAAMGGDHDAYGEHFKSRRIYGEARMQLQATAESDFEPWRLFGCIIEDGLLKFSGNGSYSVYGPYVNLRPGKYKISGELSEVAAGGLILNLSSGAGQHEIASTTIEGASFCYFIDIPCDLFDFEVRLLAKDCKVISLVRLGFEQL